jgi:non-heme chloroperoxidase
VHAGRAAGLLRGDQGLLGDRLHTRPQSVRDVPTLIIHGDDDQNVPIAATALLSSKLIKGATLKIYPGAPHGLTVTHKERFNEDLLAFASGVA